MPREFWDDEELRDALVRERHIGHAVRRYRHHPYHGHRPISVAMAAQWFNISQAQLSRIETGLRIEDLGRLVQWAKILRIPRDLLWFTLPGEPLEVKNLREWKDEPVEPRRDRTRSSQQDSDTVLTSNRAEVAAVNENSDEGTEGISRPTLLRTLIRERHWGKFETFEVQFMRAARDLAKREEEPGIARVTLSERTFRRWTSGKVETMPLPDACRALEHMFGFPVRELLAPSNKNLDNISGQEQDEHNFDTPAKERDTQESKPFQIPAQFQFSTDVADVVKRRAFLTSVATAAGFGAVGAMTAREVIRREVNLTLTARSSATDVGEWREVISEYGESYPTTEPAELLKSLMVDLYSLQDAIHSNSRETDQRALRGVGAILSAFIAQTIANLGNLYESRRWWRTAREAADESEDSYAILWIRGREIILAGYEQRPLASILRLIDELEARITDRSPARTRLQFLSGKAQTLALIGQPATDEAEKTLNRLRSSFDSVPNVARTSTNMIFSCAEEHLHFTESLTYTYLGEFQKADKAQSAALAIYPAYRLRPLAEIELQRALCLIGAGDVQSGIQHAQGIIARLPAMYRTRTIADLGHKVLSAVPTLERSNVNVQEYVEFLNTEVFVAPELTA